MYLPQYRITETFLSRVTEAEALRTRIMASPIQVPLLEKIRLETLSRRAHFSTAIEGNPLTLPEVEALAQSRRVAGRDRAKQEVLNYLATLRWISRQPSRVAISKAGVLKLHRLLMVGVLKSEQVGRHKRSANVIMSAGRVIYRPPGPKAAKPGTRALIQWLEGPGQSTHPVVASACAHYEIARLHPFADGNGRVARTLATWVLYNRGFDTQHLFAVDQYFKEDHEGYYEALRQAHQEEGDLTSWIEYVALAVVDTLHRTQRRIERLALPVSVRKLAMTHQQERLLLELRERQGATVEQLQGVLGVQRAQVYRLLRPLISRGVIRKSRGRPVVYRMVVRR